MGADADPALAHASLRAGGYGGSRRRRADSGFRIGGDPLSHSARQHVRGPAYRLPSSCGRRLLRGVDDERHLEAAMNVGSVLDSPRATALNAFDTPHREAIAGIPHCGSSSGFQATRTSLAAVNVDTSVIHPPSGGFAALEVVRVRTVYQGLRGLAGEDSNLQPPDPKSGVLPLNYPPGCSTSRYRSLVARPG